MSSTMNRRKFLKAIGTLAASVPLAAVVAGAEAEEDSLTPVPGSGVAALPQLGAGPVLASPGDNIKNTRTATFRLEAGETVKLRVGDTSYYWLTKQKLQPGTEVGLEVSTPVGSLYARGHRRGTIADWQKAVNAQAGELLTPRLCNYCGSPVRREYCFVDGQPIPVCWPDSCRHCGAPI